MTVDPTRRALLTAAPAIGLAGILAGCASRGSGVATPGGVYRIDDEATILAVARTIIAEDPVAALITIDEHGIPRARSVGVSDPDEDMTMWISTRRTSRKVGQIRNNPSATLYFNNDSSLAENFKGACYASFMGRASVHLDPRTFEKHLPDQDLLKSNWPDFPRDYAAIRFEPSWLEVYGKGIKGRPETWQPQAVMFERN